jgi:hypothetical protein
MKLEIQPLIKSLSPKFVTKAVQTFDRATTIVVGACWIAAVLMMAFALYAVTFSASTRRAAETAAAAEPVLPKIVKKPMDAHDAKPLLDRLQHRYPGITFSLGRDQELLVAATDGAKFREWLTVIGYIDTISPKYRWTMKEFCVGKCGSSTIMHAVLSGEKVSFETPKDGK